MKKIFVLILAAAAFIPSCRKITGPADQLEGTLSFAEFSVEYDAEVATKASVAAPGEYSIFIYDATGAEVKSLTYAEAKAAGGIDLLAGPYTMDVRSTSEAVPVAKFESPVYGASTSFNIIAGETTNIGSLTCTLLQCKVTVDYDEEFLKSVTGNCQTDVTVTLGSPLTFGLTYADGAASFDKSAGYFAVNNGDKTTMNVVFKGNIDGKSQKMTATLTGIKPQQWRQIKFYKKVDQQGNATFIIEINSYIDDEELVVKVDTNLEEVIGDDPDAPKGDGGITLDFAPDCTMYDDLSNIVVPDAGTVMDLRLVVTVPGGVKKFVVDISSDNEAFEEAVALTGSTTLDLINPMASQEMIFSIVPFPHGQDLLGQTELAFDLSAAQEPISLFSGKHTFDMTITDMNGCKNTIPVSLVVK